MTKKEYTESAINELLQKLEDKFGSDKLEKPKKKNKRDDGDRALLDMLRETLDEATVARAAAEPPQEEETPLSDLPSSDPPTITQNELTEGLETDNEPPVLEVKALKEPTRTRKAPRKKTSKSSVTENKEQTLAEPLQSPPTEEVAETPVEDVAEAPVEEVVESPVEEVVETPVEEVVESPVEDVVETPVEEVVESPVEDVAETPVEDVAETPIEEVAEAPIEEVVEAPVEEVVEAPVEEVVETPVEETVEPIHINEKTVRTVTVRVREIPVPKEWKPPQNEAPASEPLPSQKAEPQSKPLSNRIVIKPASASPTTVRRDPDAHVIRPPARGIAAEPIVIRPRRESTALRPTVKGATPPPTHTVTIDLCKTKKDKTK